MRLALVFAVVSLLAPPSLAAQPAGLAKAKEHAARAKVHYDLGEYQQAAREYILVYRIKPLPALLYNIAQSYRRAGQYEKARQFYKSYLRETREAKNRAIVEKAIAEIDELLANEKKAKDGPPSGVAQELGALSARAKANPPARPSPAPAAEPPKSPDVSAQPAGATQLPLAGSQQPAAEPAVARGEPAKAPAPEPAIGFPLSAPLAATSTAAPPAVFEDTPFYKRWWFWTAAGVVAVGAGTAIALGSGGPARPPSTHLGSTPVF